MKRPFVPIAACCAAGIYISSRLTVPYIPTLLPAAVFLLGGLLLIGRSYHKTAWWSFLSCVLILGILHTNLYFYSPAHRDSLTVFTKPGQLIIEGIISEPPRRYPERTEVVIDACRFRNENQWRPASDRILLSIRWAESLYAYGDYLRITTRLQPPRNFQNPGGFDYEQFLLFRNIRLRGVIDSPSKIILVRRGEGNPLRQLVEKLRRRIRETIDERSAPTAAPILRALITGDAETVPREIKDIFARAGASHILAISGLHLGMIAAATSMVLLLLMRRSTRLLLAADTERLAYGLSVVPIIVFTLISGLRMSAMRAAIMIIAFVAALLLRRIRDPWNVLAFAAFCILAIWPGSLFDVSFQLSFAAVAAIVSIVPCIDASTVPGDPDRTVIHRCLAKLRVIAIVTIAATAGTAPLAAFYFNRISLVGILSNMLVVPLTGFIILPSAFAAVLALSVSSTLSSAFISIASAATEGLLFITRQFAALPFASVNTSTPTFVEITLVYGIFFSGIRWLVSRQSGKVLSSLFRYLLPGIVLSLLLYESLIFYQASATKLLRVTVLDVGHGNSVFIAFPGGKSMLIDGGGFYDSSFDVGQHIVAPFLRKNRLSRLDTVVLTHSHEDHIGGLPYILENFNVSEVWSNGLFASTPSCRSFISAIEKHAITHRIVSAETPEIAVNNVSISVLNPPEPLRLPNEDGRLQDQDNVNNTSLVFRFVYGNVAILLPADISTDVESRLAVHANSLKSAVLVMPHHGASTSSSPEFIDAVQPGIAIVSCRDRRMEGSRNETINRYRARNIPVLRTDMHGAVTVETDGRGIHTTWQRRNQLPL
ncbi:MAG: DNA internalization-related competence protein ComEC/Rec2 [Deltaproteobacteria bacterium]|nr:DNA internalization-related competence protein ComEC/Rec2 [Deltaproteobacteria bacterium]